MAGVLGVSRVLVSHWERGQRRPSEQVLEIRRKALEVRDWLRLGQGPVGDLPGLLDDVGVTVYRTALGSDLNTAVSGAFLNIPGSECASQ